MNRKHLGRQSVRFDFPPSILSYASVVGKKEGEGPLAAYFDQISTDTHFGQTTWEKAESQMQTLALQEALKKASLSPSSVHMLFAGDLLNQCIGTSFAARGTDIPFYGLYGACSTMAESLSSCRHGRRRRLRRACRRHDLLPFCLRRAAIPAAPGIRRTADPHGTVDRHRLRRCLGGPQSGAALYSRIYHRKNRGSKNHRRQQHGRGYGSGLCGHGAGPFSGHRPEPQRLRPHCVRRPGQGGQRAGPGSVPPGGTFIGRQAGRLRHHDL